MKLLTDEDFNQRIVDGLRLRIPDLDILTVASAGLRGKHDRVVLRWAARENRVLLTHDRRTMPGHARALLEAGEPIAGVVVVSQSVPIGGAIDDLEVVVACSIEGELESQIRYLPI